MKRSTAWMIGIAFLSTACRRELAQEKGDAPPPVASSAHGLCSNGGGKVTDPIAAKLLPAKVLDYCLDPNNEVRTYGKDSKGTIEQVCTELFDGECEVYRSFGLERVVAARYADGGGSPGTITAYLSRFDSVHGALGFFTRRVLGDGDPAALTMTKLDAGTLAVQGSGTAYVWRGTYVVELAYANEEESPEAIKTSSAKNTVPLAKSIGELLPGDKELPRVVRVLPDSDRVPLGLSFEPKDALAIEGLGPGATGYYRAGGKRYRILALERANDDSGQDVIKTLKRLPAAAEVKGPRPYVQVQLGGAEGTRKIEWLFGRVGATVIGVGDEDHVAVAATKGNANLSVTEKQQLLGTVLGSLQAEAREK